MSCRELTEFIDAYLNGELSAAVRKEFDHHLSVCESCVHYLDSYRRTVELGRAALRQADAPADDAPEDLVRAILEAQKRSK
ncbi:MAG: zf-HC2 domain-containing protein [Planctomycetota bacterium]